MCPGLPHAPYQAESPLSCFLAPTLLSSPPHNYPNFPSTLGDVGEGWAWWRSHTWIWKVRIWFHIGLSVCVCMCVLSWNVPKQCWCQPAPSSLHWPHLPALPVQPPVATVCTQRCSSSSLLSRHLHNFSAAIAPVLRVLIWSVCQIQISHIFP